MAFDNFDRQIETINGKDTLHDTVGIAYQNRGIDSNADENDQIDFNISSQRRKHKKAQAPEIPSGSSESVVKYKTIGLKRRRTYECQDKDLEPYHKKPKMTCTITSTTFSGSKQSENYKKVVYQDLLWLLSVYFNQKKPLLWTGWNSKKISDESSGNQQEVYYLHQPITNVNNSGG